MIETNQTISIDTIFTFHLEDLITKYEAKLFKKLQTREYVSCEDVLTNFCFELASLSDAEQVFIARTFFIGIITDIIRVQTRKKQLRPKTLSYAYETIATIEKWENITEYYLGIPNYMKRITNDILVEDLQFAGNIHIEKALQLIHFHLEGNLLTVNWIAQQLDISTTHLANTFKLQLGKTVTQYITERKIEEICFQLTYTNLSIKDIRHKFGFTNNSHFIQYFKRLKGITPLQFKKDLMA